MHLVNKSTLCSCYQYLLQSEYALNGRCKQGGRNRSGRAKRTGLADPKGLAAARPIFGPPTHAKMPYGVPWVVTILA